MEKGSGQIEGTQMPATCERSQYSGSCYLDWPCGRRASQRSDAVHENARNGVSPSHLDGVNGRFVAAIRDGDHDLMPTLVSVSTALSAKNGIARENAYG